MRDKRKQPSDAADEQYPAKRQKDAAPKQKKVHGKDYEVLNLAEQHEGEEKKAKGAKPDLENEMKEPVPEKTKVYADQCTAFVSNLHLKANIRPSIPPYSLIFSHMHDLILWVITFAGK